MPDQLLPSTPMNEKKKLPTLPAEVLEYIFEFIFPINKTLFKSQTGHSMTLTQKVLHSTIEKGYHLLN